MRERVYLRIGKKPIIIVAPHGADDVNTSVIAKTVAKNIDGYAVVNQGFERSKFVDTDNDQANCNKISHLLNDKVLYNEFLKPLKNFKNKIEIKLIKNSHSGKNKYLHHTTSDRALIFYIHGAGDIVHHKAGEFIEVIVGYGLGEKKDSLTCENWRKNLFVDSYRCVSVDEVYEAKGGSRYAGRSTDNLNQFFRKHENSFLVESMQLEFPYSVRKDNLVAEATATKLSLVIEEMLKNSHYKHQPYPKFI